MLVRTLVHIPEIHLEKLGKLAEDKQVARAVIVRWAITEYLQKNLPARPDEGTKIPNDVQVVDESPATV